MSENWIREYELQAGPAGGNGFKVSDLHISFSLSKTEDETCNDIKIDIWNLNAEHKAMLEQKDCTVKLRAGYRNNVKDIFVGYVTYVEGEKDGADYKTSIECVDGRVECRDTQQSKSYDGSTSSKKVLDDIASDMGIPISYGDDVKHIDFPNGYQFVGNATESLDKVCASAGLSWSIQDGELQIKKNKGTMNRLGYRLSSETGLISIPKKLKQSGENSDSSSNESGYEVTFFMNADIKISDYVYLDSKEAKGYFRVGELSISGDNMSGDWVCKAKLLEEPEEGPSSPSVSQSSKATNKVKKTEKESTAAAHQPARKAYAESTVHVSSSGATHGGGGGSF